MGISTIQNPSTFECRSVNKRGSCADVSIPHEGSALPAYETQWRLVEARLAFLEHKEKDGLTLPKAFPTSPEPRLAWTTRWQSFMFDDRMHLCFSVALYWGNLAATWRSVDARSLLLCSFLFLYIMITRCRVMIITGPRDEAVDLRRLHCS